MTSAARRIPFAIGPVSFRWRPRTALLVVSAASLTLALAAFVLTLGSYELSMAQVVAAVRGAGEANAQFVVRTLRLPRVLGALLVGAALAGSGAILQGLVRNPLVAPDIIGINAGATLAAVFWFVARLDLAWVPLAAFAGAVSAAAAVYALSWRGRIVASRLVLVGIGVNALLTAATTFLTVRGRTDDVSRAYQWMAGSLYSTGWDDVRVLVLALAVLLPVAGALLRSLRVLQLGDPTARSLGMRVEAVRLALLLVSCGLCAVAVSATGPIGFVALMIPHVARMIAGPIRGGVFLFACVLGGTLVLGADAVALHALPVDLPAGVITAALGAPYFLVLLYRSGVRV